MFRAGFVVKRCWSRCPVEFQCSEQTGEIPYFIFSLKSFMEAADVVNETQQSTIFE